MLLKNFKNIIIGSAVLTSISSIIMISYSERIKNENDKNSDYELHNFF